jgi:hypothetical protein
MGMTTSAIIGISVRLGKLDELQAKLLSYPEVRSNARAATKAECQLSALVALAASR